MVFPNLLVSYAQSRREKDQKVPPTLVIIRSLVTLASISVAPIGHSGGVNKVRKDMKWRGGLIISLINTDMIITGRWWYR